MRFNTENEALDYVIGKPIKDSVNPAAICITQSRQESKEKYDKWIERKRLMFSPQEFDYLTKLQGTLSKIWGTLLGNISNQDVRDGWSNAFVDWAEEKPRRIAIIVVEAFWQLAANDIALQVDKVGGDQTFAGLGLSQTGKEPATHYGCNWNCSASEYDYFATIDYEWWQLFDGQKISFSDVIKMCGLKQIILNEGEA